MEEEKRVEERGYASNSKRNLFHMIIGTLACLILCIYATTHIEMYLDNQYEFIGVFALAYGWVVTNFVCLVKTCKRRRISKREEGEIEKCMEK